MGEKGKQKTLEHKKDDNISMHQKFVKIKQ